MNRAGTAVTLRGSTTSALLRLFEHREVLGILFVLPAVLLLGIFLAYPFFFGVWLSFTDTIIGGRGRYIGWANYRSLLQDSLFWLTTRNTFLYTIVAVWLKLAMGLVLALILNRLVRLKGLLRAIVLLPWIVPTAFSAIAFWWMYDSTFGVISWVLLKAGWISHRIDFLGDPNLARASVIVANVWRGVPFFAIGLLAGLQTVEPSLLEAAAIDGAGVWQRFWHVTLPLVMPLLVIVTTFSTIWTFSDFQLVYIITRGGPANATHLYGTLAYQRAIQGGQFGEGAAISNFIFPILFLGAVISLLYVKREE